MTAAPRANYEVERDRLNDQWLEDRLVFLDRFGGRWLVVDGRRAGPEEMDVWMQLPPFDPTAQARFFVYVGRSRKKTLPLAIAGVEYSRPLRRAGHRAPTTDREERETSMSLGRFAKTKCARCEFGVDAAREPLNGTGYDVALDRQFSRAAPVQNPFAQQPRFAEFIRLLLRS